MRLATITFAAVQLQTGQWIGFRFGAPEETDLPAVELVRQIIADYPRRRDQIWDLEPLEAIAALDQIPEPVDPQALTALVALYGQVGFPQGAPRVDAYVNHPSRQVQLAAIRSVGQMGRYGSIPLIEPFLKHPDAAFRSAAVAALGKFGLEQLLPEIEAAGLSDPQTKAAADQASAQTKVLVSREYERLADVLLPTDDYEDLVSWVSYVRSRLAGILGSADRDPLVRVHAARVLAITRSAMQSDLMAGIAADPREPLPLRVECLVGVGRCRRPHHLPVLAGMLESPEASLREAAVRGLAEYGDSVAFETLVAGWERLQGTEPAALAILGAFRLPAGPTHLSRWLAGSEDTAANRSVFFDESGQLFDAYAGDLLQTALASSNPETRRDAAWLVSFLGAAVDEDRLARLSREDPDERNRRLASDALARWRRGR